MWWTAVPLLWLLLAGPGPLTTLSGRVTDESGARVQGAEVRLFRRDAADALEQRETRRAWTVASGEFRFERVPAAASYDVLATAPGFAPARLPVSVPASAAGAPPVQLVLRRGVPASGMVVDGRGRPIAGCGVELMRSLDGRLAAGAVPSLAEDGLYRATTGEDGRFQVTALPAGRYQLILRASGFTPFERKGIEPAAGSGDLGQFTLERGTELEGRVLDPEGRPIPEAEVWVVPRNPRDWQAYYRQGPSAKSGPKGEFSIPELRRGEGISLDVCRSGYLPASLSVREVPGEPAEVPLEPAASIKGRVLDPEGQPVAGARLIAWLSGERPQVAESLRPCHLRNGTATAGGDGRFALEPLPPGWWTVRASANGWLDAESERREVLGGQSLEGLEIVLAKGATVTGRVLAPDGSPAAGAEVRAFGERSNPSTLTGEDGVYRLDGVETGERTLEATHPDYAFASASSRIEPGENRLDLTLERDPRHEIRGRVVDLNSQPVAGARVTAAGSSAYSAGDGAFVLREREGVHEIWADREGYAPARAQVAVKGGPVNGVEIRLSPGGAIHGRLLGMDRDLLAGATVEVALPPPFRQQSSVDAQGRYRLTGLSPGLWEVTARAAGRSVTDSVELAPDDEETILDLLFPPTSEVSGWVLDADGQPVTDASVRLFSVAPGRTGAWTLTRSGGGFRVEVEDGTYRVFALKRSHLSARLEEPVQVEGAPVDGLELRLGRGTVLQGRVLGLQPGERAREVWAQGPDDALRQGELDQQAQYSVLALTPGEWKVTAVFQGRQAAATVTVEEGQDEVFLDLAFP